MKTENILNPVVKKEYTPPRLVIFGEVGQLTLNATNSNYNDAFGSPPPGPCDIGCSGQ